MALSENRNGNFTSSGIVALLGNGRREMTQAELDARPKKGTGSKTTTIEDETILSDTALTYIIECNMERRLGRSLESEENARNLTYGKVAEVYVSDNKLGVGCNTNLSEATAHPDYTFWVGSIDYTKPDTAGEIKCPKTLKSFCQLVDPFYIGGLTGLDFMLALINGWEHNGVAYPKHPDGKKYYTQIVSNACIHGKAKGELLVFVPYLSEIEELREICRNWEVLEEMHKYSWIINAAANELPYLKEDSIYKNVTAIEFEIPQADKDFLTSKVIAASKLLQPFS